MTIVVATLAVAIATALVLLDLRDTPRPAPPPPVAPPPPATPPPARPAPAAPTPAVRTLPAAPLPAVESDSVLAAFAHVETDQRPRVGRRLFAAFTLLVLTLAVAGAIAAGIVQAVRAFD